jgi:hypothetical protein
MLKEAGILMEKGLITRHKGDMMERKERTSTHQFSTENTLNGSYLLQGVPVIDSNYRRLSRIAINDEGFNRIYLYMDSEQDYNRKSPRDTSFS